MEDWFAKNKWGKAGDHGWESRNKRDKNSKLSVNATDKVNNRKTNKAFVSDSNDNEHGKCKHRDNRDKHKIKSVNRGDDAMDNREGNVS